MRLGAPLLVLAWLGAGPALAQDVPPEATELPAAVEFAQAPAVTPAPDAADAPADPGSALAPTADDPVMAELNRKLLGDGGTGTTKEGASASTPRTVEDMDLPETPGWIWPVGLTLLALLIGLRWQLNRTTEAPSRLRVTQRVMLGRDGNLAVVEVGEGSDKRRLLVGYGGGAPRLVAELDVPDATPEPVATNPGTAARRWQQAVARALPAQAPDTPARPRTRSVTPDEPKLRPRTSLIAEVLAERDPVDTPPASPAPASRPSARRTDDPSPPPVVPDDENGEDGEPSETYTFRGLIG